MASCNCDTGSVRIGAGRADTGAPLSITNRQGQERFRETLLRPFNSVVIHGIEVEEKAMLDKSAQAVRGLVEALPG